MEHIREAVVAAGLASDQEVSGNIDGINAFAAEPKTILSLPRIFQVIGKKPGGIAAVRDSANDQARRGKGNARPES